MHVGLEVQSLHRNRHSWFQVIGKQIGEILTMNNQSARVNENDET